MHNFVLIFLYAHAGKVQPELSDREISYFENLDTTSQVTPVDYEMLRQLHIDADYNKSETQFLYEGFKNGFSLEYEGLPNVKLESPNLKLRVDNEVNLWNKVKKEVKLGRYTGPFPKNSISILYSITYRVCP